MDYDSYDSASEVGYSEVSSDNGDYGFDGGSDEQPRARQVRVELVEIWTTNHGHSQEKVTLTFYRLSMWC